MRATNISSMLNIWKSFQQHHYILLYKVIIKLPCETKPLLHPVYTIREENGTVHQFVWARLNVPLQKLLGAVHTKIDLSWIDLRSISVRFENSHSFRSILDWFSVRIWAFTLRSLWTWIDLRSISLVLMAP